MRFTFLTDLNKANEEFTSQQFLIYFDLSVKQQANNNATLAKFLQQN